MTFSHVTLKALRRKNLSALDVSFLLELTPQSVEDILSGVQVPTSRQAAILKLLACINKRDVERVMREKDADYEWRAVVGFERYEVSAFGQVRRMAHGKGSMPGHVLKQNVGPDGRRRVTLYDRSGKMSTRHVHVVVCEAFNGPSPSSGHMACHRDDDISVNTKDNLYWGTAKENAADRIANEDRKLAEAGFKIDGNGTLLAQKVKHALSTGEITKTKARIIIAKSMAYAKSKEDA